MIQPLTDRELRELVERCDGSTGAKQLALSYAALRTAYEDAESALCTARNRRSKVT